MNKYEIRTASKKDAIMKAALSLINEKGFYAANIKEIASQAQVSPVSIYNYFGSKENLALECIKCILNDNLKASREILKSNLPYEEKLKRALTLCSEDTAINITSYFSTISLTDESFAAILSTASREIKRDLYRDYIEAGKKENRIDVSIPTDTILKYMDCFNDIPLNISDLKNEIQNLHKLLLHGILG